MTKLLDHQTGVDKQEINQFDNRISHTLKSNQLALNPLFEAYEYRIFQTIIGNPESKTKEFLTLNPLALLGGAAVKYFYHKHKIGKLEKELEDEGTILMKKLHATSHLMSFQSKTHSFDSVEDLSDNLYSINDSKISSEEQSQLDAIQQSIEKYKQIKTKMSEELSKKRTTKNIQLLLAATPFIINGLIPITNSLIHSEYATKLEPKYKSIHQCESETKISAIMGKELLGQSAIEALTWQFVNPFLIYKTIKETQMETDTHTSITCKSKYLDSSSPTTPTVNFTFNHEPITCKVSDCPNTLNKELSPQIQETINLNYRSL